MVYFVLVQFISLLFAATPATDDRIFKEAYLGEKRLDHYAGRYDALVDMNIYSGEISFRDENQNRSHFAPYLFNVEDDYLGFMKSEVNSALSCTNEQFSRHYEDLRFAYRLITLSYLLEGQWQMKLTSDKFRLKNGCTFNLQEWTKTCKPRSPEMTKFIDRIRQYDPKYNEALPVNYDQVAWNREMKAGLNIWYSQNRLASECKQSGCYAQDLEKKFQNACEKDQELLTVICSEQDELYGLSEQRDAYYLLARSNIINTFNKDGEALGCLRRFSEVLSHRESHYSALTKLFPTIESFLIERYQERFMQGRVFFYGAAKEFEEKGLTEIFSKIKKEEPRPVAVLPEPKKPDPVKPDEPKVVKVPEPPRQVVEVKVEKKEVDTMKLKSAFLQAAEIRSAQDLDKVEVDMVKLRYDYVFSLNMMNDLSVKLKTFMTRDALSEMLAFDKLGTVEGPVPLLFLKFLIDFQEHQGLWNLISVIGDKFYVSNDIDSRFKTKPEFIQLLNDESTRRQWQLNIIKP